MLAVSGPGLHPTKRKKTGVDEPYLREKESARFKAAVARCFDLLEEIGDRSLRPEDAGESLFADHCREAVSVPPRVQHVAYFDQEVFKGGFHKLRSHMDGLHRSQISGAGARHAVARTWALPTS